MIKRIATLLGIAVLTACQSVPPPLIPPGQMFPGRVINIRAPNSEGWRQLDSTRQGMIFFRQGASPNESYVARVVAVALPESTDRDEFVALVKRRNQENTSPERFSSIEFNYEYTDKRGYPCVSIKGVADDMKARTSSGQQTQKLQINTLVCRHPRQQAKGFEGFGIDFSHRGSTLDKSLDVQAEAFIEGVQVPEK
jgi:hypothetical protein